jgi:TonB family protein
MTVKPQTGLIALALALLAASQPAGQTARPLPRDPYEPALLIAGQPPELPALGVSGAGEVALEVSIDAGGSPTTIEVLRSTPPFTALMVSAVRGWRFEPANEEDKEAPVPAPPAAAPRRKVPAKVLVVAVINPPVTLGPTLNDPPITVKPASPEVPWPAVLSAPANSPVTAVSATVLLEARIAASGRIERARVVRSSPPYDPASLETLRSWSFRPARRGNTAAPSFVYIVFGFPLPVRNA